GHAGQVLLPIAIAHLGMRLHHPARLGAVHARLPRSLVPRHHARLVLGRVLAHVHVPGAILCVPVERVLGERALGPHGRTGGGGGGAAARDQTATLMDSAAAMGMSAERRMSSSWCTPAKDA